MNTIIAQLGTVLNKTAQKSINGGGRVVCVGTCINIHGGLPHCVPCGNEEPPKE
ncbi:hypothetical protein V1T75_06185 [Tenacibaculum sp. FZY0031]|uniref:hypothetical protein n=1 Tax=Tenacibaculum sp. FZY0031 TaxID=3116648 RepID=UPI002EB59F8F|nr:hypothetical protein [Tenacibaculum sp. FZY0031]